MKNLKTVLIAVALCVPAVASAHRAWFLPAATVLSGEAPWVTVDAAVSNDLFYADHAPMRLNSLQVMGPDGGNIEAQNANTGKYRSTFDVELKQEGTYKIFSASSGLRASWETEDGKRGRWPGRGQAVKPGDFEKSVPKDAKNLQVSYSSRRMETFVTSGQPSKTALALSNEGLEMQPITHPNDLFAGEQAKFRFLIDGEPAAGTSVMVVPGAMRYRNSQDEMKLTADKDGVVSLTWPAAGMYWLEAEYEDAKAKVPAKKRQGGYVATLEVLPQ